MSKWTVAGIALAVCVPVVLLGEFAGSRGWLNFLHPEIVRQMRDAAAGAAEAQENA